MLIQDSYVHDFLTASGAHADAIQMQNSGNNLTIRHNTLLAKNVGSSGWGANSAIILKADLGPNSTGPTVVDDNFLGGGNYTLYVLNAAYTLTGVSVTNNHFARGVALTGYTNGSQYGPVDVQSSCITKWSGNVWDDTGAAIAE